MISSQPEATPYITTADRNSGWVGTTALRMLCMFVSLASGCVWGQAYSVQGVVQTVGFSPEHATPVEAKQASFSMTVDSCKWRVRVVEDGSPYDYVECGGDGQQVYSLIGLEHHNQQLRDQGKNAGVNTGAGFIESGPVPHLYRSSYVSVLWLAYASTCYFNSLSNGLAEPLLFYVLQDRNLHRHGFRQRVHLDRFDMAPHSIASATYYDDGFLYYWENGEMAAVTPPLKKRRAPPYDGGFTNAQFTVITATNVGSYLFPQQFSFVVYHPRRDGKSNGDVFRLRAFTGIATRITTGVSLDDYRPRVNGMITIADERILQDGTQPRVEYAATNHWPDSQELALNADYRRQLNVHASISKSSIRRHSYLRGYKRVIVLGVLTATALGAIWVSMVFQRRSGKWPASSNE